MANDAARFWNPRFSAEGYAYGTQPNDFVRECASRLSGTRRVLCIGDGEGRNGVYLASLGHRVTSLDASAAGLQKARRLALERGVELETRLLDLWGHSLATEKWDAIVSVFCHLPSELRRRVHGDVAAALNPGGVFVLEAYTPAQLRFRTGGPKDPELLYTVEELRGELSGLTLDLCREVEREVVEGKLHSGRAAVVQILAINDRRPPTSR
ncbi:MAG: SAM-dependent methyltransferase [Myxococcaceae bacterium]